MCIGESTVTVTTNTSSMEIPDNGDVFVEVSISTTPQESQTRVVETTVEDVEQNLSDHHHTPANSPVDVTSFIKSRFRNEILVAVIAAVILLGLIFLTILLLVIVLIRWAVRHRGRKTATNFYDTVTLQPPVPGDHLHQRYIDNIA
jgi:hypothetical protein